MIDILKLLSIFICAIALFVIMFDYRENKKGYPVSTWIIAVVGFISSLIFGLSLNDLSAL